MNRSPLGDSVRPVHLLRFLASDGTPHLGAAWGDHPDGFLDLTQETGAHTIPDWLTRAEISAEEALPALTALLTARPDAAGAAVAPDALLLPLDCAEVWGAGVTYERSRDARREESRAQEALYAHVYEAVRPELFFKAPAGRTMGPGGFVGLRRDAVSQVPEPELTVILGPQGHPFGYTVGNDMTARDIEGKNPLYLPQAKIYHGSSAMGPSIVLAGSLDVSNLTIHLAITRHDAVVFAGETTTANLHRPIAQMIDYLRAEWPLAPWTALMTGTGIVPPDYFALEDGDLIAITIEGIGTLTNRARRIGADWAEVPEPPSRLLRVHPDDNVAVALGQLRPDDQVTVEGLLVTVRDPIPFGHKVALHAIPQGARVIKYGEAIGNASVDIQPGQHVHVHNVGSARGRGDLQPQHETHPHPADKEDRP